MNAFDLCDIPLNLTCHHYIVWLCLVRRKCFPVSLKTKCLKPYQQRRFKADWCFSSQMTIPFHHCPYFIHCWSLLLVYPQYTYIYLPISAKNHQPANCDVWSLIQRSQTVVFGYKMLQANGSHPKSGEIHETNTFFFVGRSLRSKRGIVSKPYFSSLTWIFVGDVFFSQIHT